MGYLILLASLAAGFAVGKFVKLPGGFFKAGGIGLTVCLFLLIFTLGAKLGGNPDVLRQAGSIGVEALVLAVATLGGSVLLVLGYRFLRKPRGRGKD